MCRCCAVCDPVCVPTLIENSRLFTPSHNNITGERVGDIDVSAITSKFELDHALRCRSKQYELIGFAKNKGSDAREHRVYKYVYVMDLSGMGE